MIENPVSFKKIIPFMPDNEWITIKKIESIAAVTDPVLRNLQITQCYGALSTAFANRMGHGANWCTFATWASKQAGQTIRHEDLQHSLDSQLKNESKMEAEITMLAEHVIQAGVKQNRDYLHKCTLAALVAQAVNHAGNAVSLGNKKVFEEIAPEFSRFISSCYFDTVYDQSQIDSFCAQLRPGLPPDGQEFLCKGFCSYYTAAFETNPYRKAQLNLFGNLCIGFHEQNRLQPEIAASLNAPVPDLQEIKNQLMEQLFAGSGLWTRLILFIKRVFGQTSLPDKAMDSLIQRIQDRLRVALTAHVMTLALPPDIILHLGTDLSKPYPDELKQLDEPDLIELLSKVDPTADSQFQSGATDWANLTERMHYIAELFRCFHSYRPLFNQPFSENQTKEIINGIVPRGNL